MALQEGQHPASLFPGPSGVKARGVSLQGLNTDPDTLTLSLSRRERGNRVDFCRGLAIPWLPARTQRVKRASAVFSPLRSKVCTSSSGSFQVTRVKLLFVV